MLLLFFFLEKSCEGCWLGYEAWQKVFKNFLKNAGESLENTKKEVTFASLLKWWM